MLSLEREEVLEFLVHVDRESRPRPSFYALIFLAAVIATCGLITNSAAVIIGAMLVAPLMSAIVGVALAVVINRRGMLKRATFALVTGALLAWFVGWVIAWVFPMLEPGSEILSRTQPTFYDLGVAAAAGLAGAYSLLRARSSAALPGVAIATAIVPPLATAGIAVRLGEIAAAGGALLLFFSNMVAIACGGMLVFGAYGLWRLQFGSHKGHPTRQYAWWGAALVLIGVVLWQSLYRVVAENRVRHTINATMEGQLRMMPGAVLDRFTLRSARSPKQGLEVDAWVATPNSIGPPLVDAAERLLQARLRRPVKLVVHSVITKAASAQEFLRHEGDVPRQPRDPAVVAREVLEEQAQALRDAQLHHFTLRNERDRLVVSAIYVTPHAVDPLVRQGIRNLLSEALGRPVEFEFFTRAPEPAEPASGDAEAELPGRL